MYGTISTTKVWENKINKERDQPKGYGLNQLRKCLSWDQKAMIFKRVQRIWEEKKRKKKRYLWVVRCWCVVFEYLESGFGFAKC